MFLRPEINKLFEPKLSRLAFVSFNNHESAPEQLVSTEVGIHLNMMSELL